MQCRFIVMDFKSTTTKLCKGSADVLPIISYFLRIRAAQYRKKIVLYSIAVLL